MHIPHLQPNTPASQVLSASGDPHRPREDSTPKPTMELQRPPPSGRSAEGGCRWCALTRQKRQLKLDNSVIEEFLPHFVTPAVLPEMVGHEVAVGPTTCFSSVYFSTSLDVPVVGGGLEVRSKDQDFAISKKLFLKASHDSSFSASVTKETHIGFVISECKTNLDKTMFQEACATAHDVKAAVSGARYYLLCEWLDMTPLCTALTDIDEILILRKAKRIILRAVENDALAKRAASTEI